MRAKKFEQSLDANEHIAQELVDSGTWSSDDEMPSPTGAEQGPPVRLAEALALLMNAEAPTHERNTDFRPRVSILADGEHIENQTLDLIRRPDGDVDIYFKLTANTYRFVLDGLRERVQRSPLYETIEYRPNDSIKYHNDRGSKNCPTIPAIGIRSTGEDASPGVSVAVAKQNNDDDRQLRVAIGLVRITIPEKHVTTADHVTEILEHIFHDYLRISVAIEDPPEIAERTYKRSRYAWHHKRDPTTIPPTMIDRLQRSEVFPEYTTIVDPGAHDRYREKYGRFVFIHNLASTNIVPIIRAGGLMSSHERYRRGNFIAGLSTYGDMESGGADSVFTRMAIENHPSMYDTWGDPGYEYSMQFACDAWLIMHPHIADRTDWYAYPEDRYGSTAPENFSHRMTPDELFAAVRRPTHGGMNEQMFRVGIHMEDIRAVAVPWSEFVNACVTRIGHYDLHWYKRFPTLRQQLLTCDPNRDAAREVLQRNHLESVVGDLDAVLDGIRTTREYIIDALHAAGITEIHGRPVKEFVLWARSTNDIVDLAYGEPFRGVPPSTASAEFVPPVEYTHVASPDEALDVEFDHHDDGEELW